MQRTQTRQGERPCAPAEIEREVRQQLADKVSGSLVGLWLLLPEHLRLGTWDLLRGWTGVVTPAVEPRLALQLVHESALCFTGKRHDRSLTQHDFQLANGLPYLAADPAMHQLLNARTIADAIELQRGLGCLRRSLGHFRGGLLAVDPHHLLSYSKRRTRRYVHRPGERSVKTTRMFFCLDVDTLQPVAFTIGTAARVTARAVPELLELVAAILQPQHGDTLVVADKEHFTADLFRDTMAKTPFDLLVPMRNQKSTQHKMTQIAPERFVQHWAGFATATQPYKFLRAPELALYQITQRLGERQQDYRYKGFVSTRSGPETELLTRDFPQRWHIEEFFHDSQALGWDRASTLNLNVRYGTATLALLAQAVVHQLRLRLGKPFQMWTADHFAQHLLQALDGDVRVKDDTIVVTYYNAPHAEQLRACYENLPGKLQQQGISPRVPWLYDFKLDFRFK